MEFDKIVKSNFNDIEMEYGFILGNEIIFLIKVGQDAILKGYNDKYIKIAKNINEKYGFTIVVSSNHFTGLDPLSSAIDVINDYRKKMNYEENEIYYMGYSNGGLVGAWYLHKHKEITKAMLVNAPIKTNLKAFIYGIHKFAGDKLTLVYGDKDFSYEFTTLLTPFLKDNIHLEIEDGADHHFTNLEDRFQILPEKYLFNNLDLSYKDNNKLS